VAISGDGSRVAFSSENPVGRSNPIGWPPNLYVLTVDSDRDGMLDVWETTFVNPLDSADAAADADGDGQANLAEFLADTHPTGKFAQYLAEGSSNDAFTTYVAILNPHATPVAVSVRLPRGPGHEVLSIARRIPAHTRITVDPSRDTERLHYDDFSTVVESDAPVVVDRTMRAWGAVWHGGTAEAATQPSTTWYFAEGSMYLSSLHDPLGAAEGGAGARALASKWFLAEGATGSFFDLDVLIANPGAEDANVVLTYLLPDGTHFSKSYQVAKESRQTIFVDAEDVRLANTPVSIIAETTSGGPIVVERAQWWPEGR
jgi:hypothetical protein